LDGNTAEAKTHLANLQQLQQLLPKGVLLYIADTKLDTPENLLGIAARQGQFLCGGAFSPTLQQQYLQCRARRKPVDDWPHSQAHLPPEARDVYQAFAVKDKLYGEVDGRGIRLKYRLLFVQSAAKARQKAQTRERHVAKIREQFERSNGTSASTASRRRMPSCAAWKPPRASTVPARRSNTH
jgi:hypothetical protein